ncbi:MAG TPA: hypothetical protein VN695_08530 [Streptosporangiaceae bacterium]|nr:hypothetical protein [Streptosporangiaceae bacterium]
MSEANAPGEGGLGAPETRELDETGRVLVPLAARARPHQAAVLRQAPR